MKTPEEIQGLISEVQTSGVPFDEEVRKINEILTEWKNEISNPVGFPVTQVENTLTDIFNDHAINGSLRIRARQILEQLKSKR